MKGGSRGKGREGYGRGRGTKGREEARFDLFFIVSQTTATKEAAETTQSYNPLAISTVASHQPPCESLRMKEMVQPGVTKAIHTCTK